MDSRTLTDGLLAASNVLLFIRAPFYVLLVFVTLVEHTCAMSFGCSSKVRIMTTS